MTEGERIVHWMQGYARSPLSDNETCTLSNMINAAMDNMSGLFAYNQQLADAEKQEKRMSKTAAPETLEHVAKAIWNWEHDNRENEVLNIEWSLLRSEYLCRAQIAIAAYNDIL